MTSAVAAGGGTATASSTTEPVVAPPPGNPRFPLVDGVRAIAALSVLGFHAAFLTNGMYTTWWGDFSGRLEIGVAIFFVISGFLLYRPFVAARAGGRAAPRPRDYYRRRVLRIVPAYWLALTVLAIYPGLAGVFTGDWWVYYGFGQIYSADRFSNGIPQAWTLCVEVSFYLVLPLYALAIGRLRRGRWGGHGVAVELGALAVLSTACIVLRVAIVGGPPSVLPSTLLGLFDWFAAGMAIAVLSVWLQARPSPPCWARWVARRPEACWGAALALLLLLGALVPAPFIGVPYSEPQSHAIHLVSPLVGVLVLLPAVVGQDGGGIVRRLLGLRTVAWLGLVSYGIYLWHTEVMSWLIRRGALDWLPVGDTLMVASIGLALTAAIAAASYYAVERPLARLKDPRRRRAG